MIKYKRILKEKIVIIVTDSPDLSIDEVHSKVMSFIKGLEPWDNGDIEKYEAYTREMISNYLRAKRGE